METKIGTYEGPFSKQLFPMFLTYIGTTIKGLPFEINISDTNRVPTQSSAVVK